MRGKFGEHSSASSALTASLSTWKIFEGALNADILIDFLRRLVKDASKKVFLILDNLRVHHSKPVKAWLAQHIEQIEVFYLPNYSPELNPDEMANADIKQAVTSRAPARTKLQLFKLRRAICAVCRNSPDAMKLLSASFGEVCGLIQVHKCGINNNQ